MDGAAPLNPYAYGCRYGASAWTELPVEEDIHEKRSEHLSWAQGNRICARGSDEISQVLGRALCRSRSCLDLVRKFVRIGRRKRHRIERRVFRSNHRGNPARLAGIRFLVSFGCGVRRIRRSVPHLPSLVEHGHSRRLGRMVGRCRAELRIRGRSRRRPPRRRRGRIPLQRPGQPGADPRSLCRHHAPGPFLCGKTRTHAYGQQHQAERLGA